MQARLVTEVAAKVKFVTIVFAVRCWVASARQAQFTESCNGAVCYEPAHIKKDCPKRAAKKHENPEQAGIHNASADEYMQPASEFVTAPFGESDGSC